MKSTDNDIGKISIVDIKIINHFMHQLLQIYTKNYFTNKSVILY
jgi:hypothetical protein